MPESANAQLARKWFEEVWNRRMESTVHQLLHPNIVGHMEGLEVRAPADFVRARAALLDGFPDLTVTVEAVISEGDDVVVRWSASGTHRGHGLGLVPSFRQATFRGMSWLVFSEGQIVKGWDSWNQGLLMQQLGAPPGAVAGTGGG
jgi:predicted ester cyclase